MSLTPLTRLCMILAMLFAPLAMIGGHAAMAMPAPGAATMDHEAMAAPAGHCAEDQTPSKQRPSSSIDCMIACSALPATAGGMPDQPAPVAVIPALPLATGVAGLHPESDPPPPRLS